MKKVFILSVVISIVFCSNLLAESFLIKGKLKEGCKIEELPKEYSIENIRNGELVIYTEKTDYQDIIELFDDPRIVINKPPQNLKMTNTSAELSESWDSYPTFTAYIEFLELLRTTYPEKVKLDTIGYSVLNKPLIYININTNRNLPKPQVSLSSTIHGNELTGYVLLNRLSEYLLRNYNTITEEGARARKILDSIDLWIMPLNNPDGTYPKSDTTVKNATRYNKNGKDLNRNFPCQYTDDNNNTIGREPETKSMMDFVAKMNFSLSANFHTGAVLVNYPWDALEDGSFASITHNCPDSVWFYELSRVYADENPDFYNSTEFKDGVSNGSAWYSIYGGRQDWIYYYHGGREVTIELSESGFLDSAGLLRQWNINKESLLKFLETPQKGIHGLVRNTSFEPIKATIHLKSIPETDVYSDSAFGYFTRYVPKGLYNIEIYADGYLTYEISDIDLFSSDYQFYDVVLANKSSDVVEAKSSIFYNDLSKTLILNNNDCESHLRIFDLSGKNIYECHSAESNIDLSFLMPGAYFAELTFEHHREVIKFISE